MRVEDFFEHHPPAAESTPKHPEAIETVRGFLADAMGEAFTDTVLDDTDMPLITVAVPALGRSFVVQDGEITGSFSHIRCANCGK